MTVSDELNWMWMEMAMASLNVTSHQGSWILGKELNPEPHE